MRWRKGLPAFVLTAFLFSPTFAGAAAKSLSVATAVGEQGEEVAVDIIVNDATEIAGAAFTVTYEKSKLSLSKVESSFFGTFLAQGITSPSSVEVDGIMYDSPLVSNSTGITTGSMLAAARKDNGTGLNKTIFTLTFAIAGTATAGVTPITIVSSVINNVTAGYSETGETVPMLVGVGSNGTTYISHTPMTITPGGINIELPFADTDSDGINDNWEKQYFSNSLTVANATSDYDKDGYSDLQEYTNRGETDLNGVSYNPTVKNVAGGTGYIKPSNGPPPGINLLLSD